MKSLHKVMDIIEVLSTVNCAGIQQISAQTGYPPPTVHRIVDTLRKRGYLKHDPVTKAYGLSVRFLQLGSHVQQGLDLVTIARPYLQQLAAQTKENANLAIEEGDQAVYVDHIRGAEMLQLFTQLGAHVPLYCTGVGKLMLSERSDAAIDAYLLRTPREAFTTNTLIKREAVKREILQIRGQGFALDNEEKSYGVRCVSAPIRDHQGCMVGAVSVSGASQRIDDKRLHDLSVVVTGSALEISDELGFKR